MQTSAHKPRDTEDGHGKPKQVHTTPGCRDQPGELKQAHTSPRPRVDLRSRVKSTQPCDTESELRGLREVHTSHCHRRITQAPTYQVLGSSTGRDRGTEAPSMIPGTSRGLAALQLCDFTLSFPFHALEKQMVTHSSVLAWRIPGMAEPGGLQSRGSHSVGHD